MIPKEKPENNKKSNKKTSPIPRKKSCQNYKNYIKNIYIINKVEDFAQENLNKKELKDFFLQEFTDIGEDLRLFVNGDKLISGWIRKATRSFITVDKGEYSLLTNPEDRLIELAKKCGTAFKNAYYNYKYV